MVSTMKTLLLVPCADCRILKSNIIALFCYFLCGAYLSHISVISFSAVSPPTEKSVPVTKYNKLIWDIFPKPLKYSTSNVLMKKVESNNDNSEGYYTWDVVRNCGRKNNHWYSECFVLVPGNILLDCSFQVEFPFLYCRRTLYLFSDNCSTEWKASKPPMTTRP